MSASATSLWPSFVRGIGIRQLRIACGLVLFTFIVTHFVNHALGNVSYPTMEWWLRGHMAFWRHPLPTAVLFTAGIVHWGLGVYALYERRQFRYRRREILQLVLGLAIPFLLVTHFVGVRLPATLFGRDIYYAQSFNAYWNNRPHMVWVQFVLLLVAWVHGCIGLYFWLRLKRFFQRAAPYLLAAAVLLPALALLGLVQGGRAVVALSKQPEWRAATLAPFSTPPQQRALQDDIIYWFQFAYGGVLLAVFAARGLRSLHERRGGRITLAYPNGVKLRVPRGWSVLEASLRHNVPHASVCGGKARCSTCRIRVVGDASALPPPSPREAFVLQRVGVGADPNVRLACQLRPTADLAFFPLLPPQLAARIAQRTARMEIGKERYIVAMFVDLRRSTALAAKRLPFDTMFLINRFLGAVAGAIEAAGGQPNQFVGDGLLALFGLDKDGKAACRQALDAVERIAAAVEQLNRDLAADLAEPLRYGIGVNGGVAIVGDVGYRDRIVFTALGDAVNVAARLQDLTKTLDCAAVVSEAVCRDAGMPADPAATSEVPIRGRDEPLRVRAFGRSITSNPA